MLYLSNPSRKKHIAFLLISLLMFQTSGCHYFKYKTLKDEQLQSLKDINKLAKFFFVHTDTDVYTLKDVSMDATHLKGVVTPPEDALTYYYVPGRTDRFWIKEERTIIHEVHINLTKNATDINPGSVAIPLDEVDEIKVLEKNRGKSATVSTFTVLGFAAGTAGLITALVFLLKSSCPYVYVHDGNGHVFEGEIFGGAIGKNLERDDYMPLPTIQPTEGEYQIRISNELKERQYTDIANLMVVNHAPGQKVLLDKDGKPHLIEDPQEALTAKSPEGTDISQLLQKKDKASYLFNDASHSVNAATLRFNKPEYAESGKLLLRAQNSMWFDYMVGEYYGKFGSAYPQYVKKLEAMPDSVRLNKLIERNVELSVSIKVNNEWQFIDHVMTVGPLASRDIVIPVDLSEVPGNDIEIRIETGFLFWELDYAAMDYTINSPFEIEFVKPSIALGTGAQDWTASLSDADQEYMHQETVGDVTSIIYKAPLCEQDQIQSVFLHTRGYYELIRDFKGLPDIAELMKFKDPSYFSEYSRAGYLKILEKEDALARLEPTDD